ncbi:hypothetical protein ACROYT_G038739 [Oculina patagonica]
MADRACRNFQPNVFNKSKCQNCFKLRDAHGSSSSSQDSSFQSLTRKQSGQKVYSRLRTVVKSGVLCITTHESVEKGKVLPSRWNKRWFVLNSTGTLDFFFHDEQKNCSTERLDGNINLDFCSGMFIGEADTGEPFSIGLKLGKTTYYLKAENRLELDNWSRVLKPFVQASQAFVPRRSSSSSSDSDVFVQGTTSTVGRVPSFGKTSVSKVSTTPLSTVTTGEQQASLQLEKLKDENQRLREQSVLSARQKDSAHILELELKTKVNRIKELEKEHSQCRDYQKALLFQEKELLEARSKVNDLKQQLEEKEKLLQQHKGKLSIHAKELAEAKADLQEANSIIGIHRANIESLKSELSSVKHVSGSGKEKLILAGEEPESDQVFSLKADANGHDSKDLESKLSVLMQKLKQNERELLVKTRELEKANESRSKVAKYTRSLLQELESKLSNNERKLSETENQLVNKNLELEYEKERRVKVEEENSRLFSELELLSDERKKGGLSKEVVELLNRAKERVASENIVAARATSIEAGVTLARPESLSDDEPRTRKDLSYVEELDQLKLALASVESASEQGEASRSDNETALRSANKEIDRLKESLKEKQQDVESLKSQRNRVKDDLKKRESELENLHKELRKLEDRNADVVEKNRELEERLQTVESELTESMEREIFLQTENETDEGERWDVKERIVGLEEEISIYKDKIDELEAKLSEKESSSLNSEADKKRLYELERLLKRKEDELRETERNCARREKELMKEEEAKRDEMEIELNRGKLRLEELENQFEDVQKALESEQRKLKGRDGELDELKRKTELMVYREDAERHIDELESELKDQEEKLSDKESSLAIANERIAEYEEKLRSYESTEKDFYSKNTGDLENKIRVLQDELEERRDKLAVAEEKLLDYEVEEKLLSAELQKSKKEDEFKVDEVKKKLTEAEERIKKYEDYAKDKNSKLIESEEKVIELAEELARRLTVEQETAEWIEGVESNLSLREKELNTTRESLVSKAKELDKEKYSILDVMELSMKYIKELELAIGEEKENSKELERQLDDERSRVTLMVEEIKNVQPEGSESQESVKVGQMEERLAFCEKSREMEATRVKELQSELEDSRKKFAEELSLQRDSHDDEMRKLNEETLQVSGAASSEADELKLRLTSRVITLQSDISELKASHQQEIEKLRAQHKKELENARREAILESSAREVIQENDEEMAARVQELEVEMKDMTERYESQMELLKKSHSREMDKLKRSSGDGGDGLQTEVVQLQVEMENMSQKYMEEIENLKVQHGEELEQLKRDMAVVLQASLGAAPSPAKADDSNVQQLKTRIHELEQETEELSRKYNEELKTEREKQQREIEQTRNDMMTVIQAIRSEKYADVEGSASPRNAKELPEELSKMQADYEARIAQLQEEHQEALRDAKRFRAVPLVTVGGEAESDSQLQKRVNQLESELASCREEFQKQLSQKETKHEEEVNLLKADMLVAIQVARSGTTSPNGANQPDSQTVTNTITHAGVQLSLEEAMAKIDDLEDQIEKTKKQAKKEKSDLERSLKKSEAATMFGLRRTEDMSIKIYQMQKEMESIDRKYQKEIKMYKDAFEREKEEKCKMGDWETLASENDSLRLEIEELDLRIEEMENAHAAEVNMYKQKLGEEKMQNVEDLRLKIKGLEDVIEEQKLEHEKELEDLKQERDASVQELKRRHEKELESVKSEQRNVLNGTAGNALVTSQDLQQKEQRIKDLELKVEEQETLLEVKRRRHKEEIKNLRQRLDDELQKHSEDVRSHRSKVRMLERRKSEHSISFGFVDDDYKRMYDEQRSENIKLKFTVEKQKKEVEEMRAAMAKEEEKAAAAAAAEVTERRRPYGESRRPVSDSFPSSFSYSRSSSARDSSPTSSEQRTSQEGGPLSRQTSEGGVGKYGTTFTRQSSSDVGKGKPLTRQLSKGVESSTMGSVAARVALYQTVASKFKDKDEKTGQRKP